jgi:hypothetical protein
MTKKLYMKQSENSNFEIGVGLSYTNTIYKFFVDNIKLNKGEYTLEEIFKINRELCEYIELEIIPEIERRRNVEPLGYYVTIIHPVERGNKTDCVNVA